MSSNVTDGIEFRTTDGRVYAVSSDGKTLYEITMTTDGKDAICSCPGFKNRSFCKHVRAVRTRVEQFVKKSSQL